MARLSDVQALAYPCIGALTAVETGPTGPIISKLLWVYAGTDDGTDTPLAADLAK